MISNFYLKSLVLITIGVSPWLACAMKRTDSSPCLREVYNQSPATVYLHYVTFDGTHLVRKMRSIAPQSTWRGTITIPSDSPTLALVEPTTCNMRHIQIAQATPEHPVMPHGLRSIKSMPDLTPVTTVKITENYVIEHFSTPINPANDIKLTISPFAFSTLKPENASGIVVDRIKPTPQ